MAKLSNLLKLPRSKERQVLQVLQNAEKNKSPIRIEIENSGMRFFSILTLKRGLVVIAKPPGVKTEIARNGYVRFKNPEDENQEVRLQVTVPHFNLLSGSYVFLCQIPKEFAETSKRNADRYNTSRFNNLHLYIPTKKGQYRIIDISMYGCKVFLDRVALNNKFEVGTKLSPATISIGGKVDIDLDSVVPRSQHKNTVGFQLVVGGDGSSGKYLSHFLTSLETAESTRLRADSV